MKTPMTDIRKLTRRWIAVPAFGRAAGAGPLLIVLLLAAAAPLRAQSFSLDWFIFDGGGGASSGGTFALTGTIGQPEAGTMSGGQFTLIGGFWSVIATVPTSGAPTLTVSEQNGDIRIAWLKPADGWILESTPALAGPALQWTAVAQAYQDDGTSLYVTVNAPSGSAFFRLHKP